MVPIVGCACMLLLGASLTGVAVHEPRRHISVRTATTVPIAPATTVAATTTTAAPKPPEVLFTVARGVNGQSDQPPAVMAVGPDGRNLRAVPGAPTVPLVQLAA